MSLFHVHNLEFDLRDSFREASGGWHHRTCSTAVELTLSRENYAVLWNNSQNLMSTSGKMTKGSIRNDDDYNWMRAARRRRTVPRSEWNEFVAMNRLYRCIEYASRAHKRSSGQWIDVQSSINHLRLVSVARGNALAIVRCTMQRRVRSQTGAHSGRFHYVLNDTFAHLNTEHFTMLNV